MIRAAIDFYSDKLRLVEGIGKIVPYFRESKNQSKTVDFFKDASGKIDCAILNYTAVSPFAVGDDGPKLKSVTLMVTVLKQFFDHSDYDGSSQKDFDNTIENLFSAFDTHQSGNSSGGVAFTILPIDSDIEVLGDDGVSVFFATSCHAAQYKQTLVTI